MFLSLGLGAAGGLGFVGRFNYPADVSLGTNGTLFVADLHSLRRISMPENPTTVLGVGFDGRVTTAAGGAEPGEADGTGPEVQANILFFDDGPHGRWTSWGGAFL